MICYIFYKLRDYQLQYLRYHKCGKYILFTYLLEKTYMQDYNAFHVAQSSTYFLHSNHWQSFIEIAFIPHFRFSCYHLLFFPLTVVSFHQGETEVILMEADSNCNTCSSIPQKYPYTSSNTKALGYHMPCRLTTILILHHKIYICFEIHKNGLLTLAHVPTLNQLLIHLFWSEIIIRS